jgi:hypothetical protein
VTTTAESNESNNGSSEFEASLAGRAGTRPDGFLASLAWWLIQVLEPLGYAAGFAVGFGLWALLDFHVMALSEVPTVALMVGSAAGLWWAAWQIGRYDFAETWRLGNVMYSAAIGTTAWIAWVATDGALAREVRFTITALIVAGLAFGVQWVRRDLLSYVVLLGGVAVSAVSAAATIAGAIGIEGEGPIALGGITAATIGYLIAGRSESDGRRDVTNLVILAASSGILIAAFMLPDTWRLVVAAGGFVAAAAANWAYRPTPRTAFAAAVTSAALATPLAMSWLPWVRIIGSIPVPIMLIVAGSAVLAALSWATRRILSRTRSNTQAASTP